MFTYKEYDQLHLVRYTNLDYTGCIDSRRSSSDYIFLIVGRWRIQSRGHYSYTVIIRVIELYCNSDKSSTKSKHINIKFLVIKDKVHNHIVSVDNVSTILNITDPLTKGLSPKVFLEHIAHIGMTRYDDILIQWEGIILCIRYYF